MNVLVVAAHPDDEVLGCGATIARHASDGDRVAVAIMGEGATSRYTTRSAADPAEVDTLARASREAAAILQAADHRLFGLPDNRFDTVALLDIVKLLEELIAEIRPRVVYTHHAGDLNVDHEVVARAVTTATRPVPGHPVREVLAFEVNSSTEWAFHTTAQFRPSVFVDISEFLDHKLRALDCYEDELRDYPHSRSRKAVEHAARRRGSVVGCAAAEAFVPLRVVR